MPVVRLALLLLVHAAPASNPYLGPGIGQVRQLDEQTALRTLERARAWSGNTPEVLAQVYLWTGLAYAGLNQPAKARESFRSALLLNPKVTLPEGASPRVQAWWREEGGPLPVSVVPAPPAVTPPPSRPSLVAPPATVPVSSPALGPPSVQRSAPVSAGRKGARRPWARVLGITLGSGAAASALTGLYFGLQSNRLGVQGNAAAHLGNAYTLETQARHQAQSANVCFVVAGAAALAGGAVLAASF